MDITPGIGLAVQANQSAAQQALQLGMRKRQDVRTAAAGLQDAAKTVQGNVEKSKEQAAVEAFGAKLGIPADQLTTVDSAKMAISSKLRQMSQENEQKHAEQMQKTGFEHAEAGQRSEFSHAEQMQKTGFENQQAGDEAALARREALSRKVGGEEAELGAPVPDMTPTILAAPMPGATRPASREDISKRAAGGRPGGGSYMQEALGGALSRAPGPKAPPMRTPAQEDLDVANAEESRARAKSLGTPKPVTQRKWEPATQAEAVEFFQSTHPAKEQRPGQENKDAVERVLSTLTPQERQEFDDLQQPAGDPVLGGKAAARRKELFAMANQRAAGSGGAGAGAAGGAIDQAAKAKFDAMKPVQQEQFLQRATPEQRAKVGR